MLDEEVKGRIIEIIREITYKGKQGVLLVTHDISAASGLCEKLMVMEAGRIVEEGAAQRILTAPEHPLTRNLIEVATDVKGYWKRYGKDA
jgi:ABC-type dipeptide/oligopeptide/nickel transport system, ATPase component